MTQGQTVKTDPRASFSATLPLRIHPRFTSMELLMTVCDMLEGTGVTAQVEPELSSAEPETEGSRFFSRPETPPRVGLTINGITLLVQGRDKPAFASRDLDNYDFGNWISGKDRILRARSHVKIAEYNSGPVSDLDFNYDRAAAMSVAAAAVDRLIGVVGLVWHTSRRAVASDEIGGMFKGLMDGSAPVGLWVSSLPLPDGAKGSATRGFYGLLGAELAILSPDLSADQANELALELAAEILRGGEAPPHGERLQYGDGLRFKVEHRAIGVDGGVPIVVLAQTTDTKAAQAASDAAEAAQEDAASSEPEAGSPAVAEPVEEEAAADDSAERAAVTGGTDTLEFGSAGADAASDDGPSNEGPSDDGLSDDRPDEDQPGEDTAATGTGPVNGAAAEGDEAIPQTARPETDQGESGSAETTGGGEDEETPSSEDGEGRDRPGSVAAAGAA